MNLMSSLWPIAMFGISFVASEVVAQPAADKPDLKVGDEAMVLAVVKRVQSRRTRQRRALVEVDVFDGTSYLRCGHGAWSRFSRTGEYK